MKIFNYFKSFRSACWHEPCLTKRFQKICTHPFLHFFIIHPSIHHLSMNCFWFSWRLNDLQSNLREFTCGPNIVFMLHKSAEKYFIGLWNKCCNSTNRCHSGQCSWFHWVYNRFQMHARTVSPICSFCYAFGKVESTSKVSFSSFYLDLLSQEPLHLCDSGPGFSTMDSASFRSTVLKLINQEPCNIKNLVLKHIVFYIC